MTGDNALHGSVRTHRGYGRCRVRRCHQSPCWLRHPRHGRPKNTETCRAARYRAQGRPPPSSEARVQKCHHTDRPGTQETPPPPRRQKSPTRRQPTRLTTGSWWETPADKALHWSTCSFRVVAGGNPNEQAPQRLGAGLPDPDRASAMNAARCPSPHIAWHRTSACRGPRQQEHPASVDRRAPWPRRDPRASETISYSRICCPEVCGNSTHRHIRSPASKSIGPHRRHAQQ